MANPKSRCSHVVAVRGTSLEDIKMVRHRHNLCCSSCGFAGPNLWLCLHSSCLYVGCGESKTDHSSIHAEETRHPLTLNITTRRIWCYRCECEVFVDSNHPPFILKTATNVSTELERERFLKTQPYNDSDSDVDNRGENPRGLTGLCNIGNTCYMNGALQALSNCPPLTRFFIDCPGFIPPDKKLARSYMKLMHEMWHKHRPNYIVPNTVASALRQVHPMFRGFLQHDSQEFLRCMMDYLHEELKQPFCANPDLQCTDSESSDEEVSSFSSLHMTVEATLFSDTDYETCDSGLSSEHSSVAFGGVGSGDGANNIQSTDQLQDLGSEPVNRESTHQSFDLTSHNGNENDEKTIILKCVMDAITVENQNQQVNDIPSNVNILQSCISTEHNAVLSDTEVGELEKTKCSRNFIKTSSSFLRELSDGCDKSGKMRSSPFNITSRSECKKPKTVYCSIVSDVFDGEILSSVQCMTCHRISCTNETFQDLSLPIPNKDHLALIRASSSLVSGASVPLLLQKAACADLQQKPVGWFAWMYGLVCQIPGWFWGPAIRLQDCLAAFFSADDLKGENMYSCEKCKKLRNGIKFSRVLKLPEVLCIHLKRFRHEYMYSSKISNFVSFPMEGLDMHPYLHKDCKNQVSIYNLVAVICHHGTAGGGHYTTYGFNYYSQTWYEFDDQVVTEVDLQQVENCEAYVLFYRKMDEDMIAMRQKANQITEVEEAGFVKFYISRQWINKFNTFAEPGPINNYDFLCRHGDVQPKRWQNVSDLAMEVPQVLWEFLHQRYCGGPAVNHLSQCQPCLQEFERLKRRQQYEMEHFLQLHEEFQRHGASAAVYALNMAWFHEWENFVRAKTDKPPGPIDNSKISVTKGSSVILLMNSDHGQMSEDIWNFFRGIYGGGPELLLKQSGSHKVDETGDTKFSESATRQITS